MLRSLTAALRPLYHGTSLALAQGLLHGLVFDIMVTLQQVGESLRAEIQGKLRLEKIGDIFGAIASVATVAKDGFGNIEALISKAPHLHWQNIHRALARPGRSEQQYLQLP